MDSLSTIKNRIPDYAKDLRLNLDAVLHLYVDLTADPELGTLRPDLRMNAYATHGGVDRTSFELYALAASIVGKCEHCVQSHYKILRDVGLTTQQLRDIGRIAAVVNAVAQVLAAERVDASETVAAQRLTARQRASP